MGDTTEYGNMKGVGASVSNGVIVVRSLQWPGAYSFYYNGQVYSIYLGSGHKYEQKTYFPVFPPMVKSDPEEYDIMNPPAPKKEPVAEEGQAVEGE